MRGPEVRRTGDKCRVVGHIELLSVDRTEQQQQLRALERLRGVEVLSLLERVTSGRSKSSVFVADATLTDDRGTYTCFLKIYHSRGSDPNQRHSQAYATALQPFMPQILSTTPQRPDASKVAILYVPSGHHETFVSLERLLQSRPDDAVELVQATCEALLSWNGGCVGDTHAGHPMSPWALLRRSLDHSQDPAAVAYRFSTEPRSYADRVAALGVTPDASHLRLVGPGLSTPRVLPNPVAFVYREDLWTHLADATMRWPRGHVHGDLNARNILSSQDAPKRLALIDFETYDPDSLAFYDLAKMELAILETVFDPRRTELRNAFAAISADLAGPIEEPDVTRVAQPPQVLADVLRPIRQAVSTIGYAQPGSLNSYRVARVAAGLELSRKAGLTSVERVVGLVYAGDSLAALGAGIDRPPDSVVAPLRWEE